MSIHFSEVLRTVKLELSHSCADTATGEVIHIAAQSHILWPCIGPSVCTHLRAVSAQSDYQPYI